MYTTIALQVIAATFGLAGQYFVNKQNITGFYFWLLSNAALIVFQVMHEFWVFVGLHVIYFLMAVHGIYVWNGRCFFKPKVEGSVDQTVPVVT